MRAACAALAILLLAACSDPPAAETPVCGDATCNGQESCSSCPGDCGVCPRCGDGVCAASESCSSCLLDCGACTTCGDGHCEVGESCATCADDCACQDCGNGACDANETCATCPGDCGSCCGNGRCDPSETCATCPDECGACAVCGDGTCSPGETCNACRQDCPTGCCTPVSSLPQPPSAPLTTSGCGTAGTCGGSPEGTWDVTAMCAPSTTLLSRVYGVCSTARITMGSTSASGRISFGGGKAKFDVEYRAEVSLVLPNNCTGCQCALKESQLSGNGYDASCSPQCAGGDCFCTLTRTAHIDAVVDYTTSGSTLDTSDGNRFQFCRNGTTLELADMNGATQEGRYTLSEAGPVPETCDGFDNDFNGTADDGQLECPDVCARPIGVCAEGHAGTCNGEQGWSCSYTSPAYERTEASCDGLDNDCDGEVDDSVPGAPLASNQVGVCLGARKACGGTIGWVDDYSAVARHESPEVSCDGLDNDCDGAVDEELTAPAAHRQQGVCAGASQVCAGAAGWAEPDYTAVAGYETAEATCDNLDNDCDGQVDEGINGTADAANQNGICAGSKQVCRAGSFVEPDYSARAGWESPEITCDGLDNDCDGQIDEGLTAPLASKQQGVCAGAIKVCAGASGWIDPDYALIARYQTVEDVECDGVDNDCDGRVDGSADSDRDGYYNPSRPSCVASWQPLDRLDCDDASALYNARCLIHVDARATGAANGTSWADAFPKLETALAAARRGYEVWVAAGRYVPPASYPSAFVIGADTALYGGFAGTETARDQRNVAANLTLLTGDVNGDDGAGFSNRSDNRPSVLRADASFGAVTATLDGFTVAGANGGSALSLSNGAALTVASCTFRDNSGVPVAVDSYGAATTFTDCSFTGNRGTSEGGALSFRSGGTCTRCRFVGNSSSGSGGALAANETTVVDSTFEGNSSPWGGAISAGGTVRVLNSRFVGNSTSGNGGAINITAQYAQPVIAGCLFTGNRATGNGGAIYEGFPTLSGHTGTVVNCSFANNSAAAGGAVYGQGTARVEIVNAVLFGNAPTQTASSGANQLTTSYTCIDQNVNGTSVIKLAAADPFVQVNGPDGVAGNADDDLHLKAGSACVGSGSNAAVPADLTVDLDGRPRLNGTVDRGAFEQ